MMPKLVRYYRNTKHFPFIFMSVYSIIRRGRLGCPLMRTSRPQYLKTKLHAKAADVCAICTRKSV